MLVYVDCECFVMQMLYVCVLCASCGSSQCCVLHNLQFVNAGRGCNRRPCRRGILQSRSHNCFIGSHEYPHVSNFTKVMLVLPATSVASKRVVSTAGNIINGNTGMSIITEC